MVTAVKGRDLEPTSLRFGAGLNTRASEDEIDDRECSAGQNFLLDLDNRELRNRPPFDLAGTAPNGLSINGFAQLTKVDGTRSTLVQAGTVVYEWDGSNFTSVGSVASGSKIRGRLEQNWPLTDIVIITDLEKLQPVMQWDGSSFIEMPHNLTGDFLSKYCWVSGERAYFANVISNGTDTPSILVASKVSDNENLSVSNRPSSSLGADDPFYLVTPDLKAINGLSEAFGRFITSTVKGKIFKLEGSSAKDFLITDLHPDSGVSGDEAMAFIGNDVIYGRQGRIETLARTDQFGDVETDDISRMISNAVEGYEGWTIAFNKRLQRVYCFPEGEAECWVLEKSILDEGTRNQTARALTGKSAVSPWALWRTDHPMSFLPTAVMNFYDPLDGLEYVFMGDASGNIYRLEGSGTLGDGGNTAISMSRTSKLFTFPLDVDVFDVQGWIEYRKSEAFDLTITLLWAGLSVFNETITINATGISDRPVYSGGLYYNDESYYSAPFAGRFIREKLGIAGKSSEFQIRLSVSTVNSYRIREIRLRVQAAS